VLSKHVQNDSKKTASDQQMRSDTIGHMTGHVTHPGSLLPNYERWLGEEILTFFKVEY